jgi:hypothetical protein
MALGPIFQFSTPYTTSLGDALCALSHRETLSVTCQF